MKKAVSLILALVMCLSLCACGGNSGETAGTLTKDEMVETAESLDCATILSDYEGNPVNNIPDYIGKGDNIHIVARVGKYNENSGLFELDPISTEVR